MTPMPRADHNSGPQLNKPGLKECADIIVSAIEQGCRFEEACGRKAHARLLPPVGPPIVIGSTPSTGIERRYLISRLKRSGFGFQWSQSSSKKITRSQAKKEQTVVSVVPDQSERESWGSIHRCPDFEISSAGRCRWKWSQILLTPTEHGTYVLTGDNDVEYERSATVLCKKVFGHHPKKGLILDDDLMPTEEPDDEEETIVSVEPTPWPPSEDHYPPDEKLDSGQQDEAQRDHERTVRWEPVLIEGVVEGYEVSADAAVLAPETRFGRKLLVPSPPRPNRRCTVQLRRTDGKYRGHPLNEIVLEAFEVRPGPNWFPEHLDGNNANCELSNLRWAEFALPEEPAVPEEPTITVTRDIDANAERTIEVDVHDHVVGTDTTAIDALLLESDPEIYGTPVYEPRGLLSPMAQSAIDPADRHIMDDQMHLPVRVFNLLRRGGFITYGDVIERSAEQLQASERGWTYLDSEGLRGRLKQLGLSLKPDPCDQLRELEPVDDGISERRLYTHDASGVSVYVNADGSLDHQPITIDSVEIYSKIFARIKRG